MLKRQYEYKTQERVYISFATTENMLPACHTINENKEEQKT